MGVAVATEREIPMKSGNEVELLSETLRKQLERQEKNQESTVMKIQRAQEFEKNYER